MITTHPAGKRGTTRTSWLTSFHSFSFNTYYDPAHVHFGPLRVLNDDIVAPGGGFPTHPHDNMEIITWVLEGALAHGDSMGNSSVIEAGDVQRMSAGSGITHSEYNASKTERVHFLQIWFFPRQRGIAPSYQQKSYPREERTDRLLLVASGSADTNAVWFDQDAAMHVSALAAGSGVEHLFAPQRGAYVYVTAGAVRAGGNLLEAGDGAIVRDEERLLVTAEEASDVVLFDVPLW